MEAQLQRPPTHGHHLYEDDPRDQGGLHSDVMEGGSHHEAAEKKSVLKKVKEKAKKIKDTIKKHSHGHEHEEGHEYRHDQISEEEDDDDDDEEEEILMVAPQPHGTPVVYESPVIPGTKLPIQTDLNLEKPAGGTREDYFINPKVKNEVHHYARDEAGAPAMPFPDPAREPGKELHQIISLDVVDKKETNVAEPAVMIGSLMGLEEDPHSPKNIRIPSSNYQSKVADPNTGRGGKEADVAPLLQRLDNIHIHDQSKPAAASEQSSCTENPELPRGTIGEKISSATSVIADKAVSAKNVVASKLGYGGEAKEGGVDSSKKPVSELATEYGHKVAETLAPVYERVAGAGSAVLSKVQGGGDTVVQGAAADKGVSMKQYLAEKFKPGEEDKALSEAIADAFHKREEVVMKTEEDRPIGVAVIPEEAVVERVISTDRKEVVPPAGSDQTGVVNRLKGTVKMWIGGKSAADAGGGCRVSTRRKLTNKNSK
ncbi:hypothetical protein ABFS82_06G033900 [Erythranthe guttata]|uniref:low-temperature-induced 65 kDa protein-like n=1 Tax=Erythranthe guttata TaxID=4155 RepID=UPI00064DA6C3|nr:PREDICTED: low-temperature-induced 65 kDa protein-like [Erythranthe guttata]|eukprot:XP_012851917.1 PREDICTED: low-temperature-induced 65 kDa protein-like [Erythranthe guttata]